MPLDQIEKRNKADASSKPKIGLALSGGGFRASIFHLGVIRRLEELGIMKDISVISTVSGGSIIGAYYVCEMERRLRKHRDTIKQSPVKLDSIRLTLFEQIADDFFKAVQHNLRSRALIFSPFYHPLLFIKSLWPGYSRSDIIQKEYDTWLFDGNSLDQLPSVTHTSDPEAPNFLAGPKLVINTTSLLDGQRESFSRVPISGLNEMKKVNKNVLKLARVVGASACVPGLFPPTKIGGKPLVDGGVSDNQGIDGLLAEGREDGVDYDLIIVSDASGQFSQRNEISTRALPVLQRMMGVFQHEIRNKEIEKLALWKARESTVAKSNPNREFAFFHLYLNLKDRTEVKRVKSEYIEAVAEIRTDLDQFSMVEREALMYHGYTLVDAQLQEHCENFTKHLQERFGQEMPALAVPPLFRDKTEKTKASTDTAAADDDRVRIKKELRAGSQSMFLVRSVIKHGAKAWTSIATVGLIPFLLFFYYVYPLIAQRAQNWVGPALSNWWDSTIPDSIADWLSRYVQLQIPYVVKTVTFVLVGLLVFYILLFCVFTAMRRNAIIWDEQSYRNHTGVKYDLRWKS